jgi:hypothetical protein
MRRAGSAIVTAGLIAFALPAFAEELDSPSAPGSDTPAAPPAVVDEVNNPLASAFGVHLSNYYAPTLYGESDTTNSLLTRTNIPFTLGLPQIARFTVPLITLPDLRGGDEKSGLGDITAFDVFLLPGTDNLRLGVGPQATFPTASSTALGDQKWNVGVAAIASWTPSRLLMFNSTVTWETSIAGKSSRPNADVLTFQPDAILYVGGGFYLRSSGRWMFDFANGRYIIPFGLGGGRVTKVDRIAVNMFLEPQFTVLHSGNEPAVQVLAGLGFQLQ